MSLTDNPRGSLYVAAPLGMGRRLIAPQVGPFLDSYPEIDIRLRLSDRVVDLTTEGLDLAFFLGEPADSTLRIRKIADCRRVLCASPEYIDRRGHPATGQNLISDRHECLNLRFPGATEFQWKLVTPDGPQKFAITGRCECDDGDVLTDWALNGRGVVMKPVFEVAEHLLSGALVVVAGETPPTPVQMACLYTHRRHQDPKTRLFMDYTVDRIGKTVKEAEKRVADQPAPSLA